MSTEVFVDTSALYAVLAADDRRHREAAAGWERLLVGTAEGLLEPVVHGGIVTETVALVQSRLGIDAVRALLDDMVSVATIVWVDRELNDTATSALLASHRRDVSLVDWTSFVVMRRRRISEALAFDQRFVEQGFDLFR